MKKIRNLLFLMSVMLFILIHINAKISLYNDKKNSDKKKYAKRIKSNKSREISILLKKLKNDKIINSKDENLLLIGNKNGLYLSDFKDRHFINIWKGGEVRKIIKTGYGYFLLTSKGIVFSENLKDFKFKNKGIYEKNLISYTNNTKKVIKVVEEVKDIKIDINNNSNLAACSKNYIYYSLNRGEQWKCLKNPAWVSGLKSVSLYTDRDIYIVVSHSVKGLFIKNLNRRSDWVNLTNAEIFSNTDEISDLIITKENNNHYLYCSLNFNPAIYRINLRTYKWEKIMHFNGRFDLIEGLFIHNDLIYFSTIKGIIRLNLTGSIRHHYFDLNNLVNYFTYFKKEKIESLFLSQGNTTHLNLNNLWLIRKDRENKGAVSQYKGIYINTDNLLKDHNIDKYIKLLKDLKLNMIVTDMKDDFGNLRFEPKGEYLKKFNFTKRVINIDKLIKKCRENNIYLAARIVLFKDRCLYKHNNNEFALKDIYTKQGWMPYVKNGDGSYNYKDEYWVDPFSEKVWEYNIEVSKELISRGFNEIQFDYIRFPTDGDNIGEYYSEYRTEGMNKESAIESFLNFAKENITVPISVDIYGANGWYRSGCVTGQDVDMIKNYVDIICPMYYPSHFKDDFLNYHPFDLRPYRIYFYGSLRNYYIAESQLIVRPWIQAFKLNVKYDNQFFSENYILNQIKGCEDSINQGYAFWNASGNYKYIKFLKDLNKEM
ncbi:MAG: hypothetical protein JXB50_00150 [Spirochaetes bacterium]|nr:hypothetical protein [Spirochaetota bacterium]